MQQPDYDRDFGEIIRWLKQEGLILLTDLEGNTELSTRAERIDRKKRKATEIPPDSLRLS
jgi:hypothetical protein